MLNFLFYACVAVLSLGQFSAVLKQGEANIYLFDIVIAIFSLYGLVSFWFVKKSLKIPVNLFAFIFFALIAGISLIRVTPLFSNFQLLVAGFYLIRFVLYLLAGIVVYNMVITKMISVDCLYYVFVYSAIFVAVMGFIQLILLPDFETLPSVLGWDPHKNRLSSTFFDPNFAGAYLVLVATLIFERIWGNLFTKINHNPKVSAPALLTNNFFHLAVILTAIFFTFSRSAWAMLAVVILVYGMAKIRWLLWISLILAFLIYFAVPRIQTRISGITDPADSAAFRLISWNNTAKIIKDNFWLGVGFNTYRYAQKDYSFLNFDNFLSHAGAGSDASLLFVFATTGIVGFTFYLLGWLKVLFSPNWPFSGLTAGLKPQKNIFLISMVLSLLLNSVFINSLFYPQILFFWMVWVVLVEYRRS